MKFKTPEFHKELYILTGENRVAIAAPRSFAKSSIFSLIYPLWATLYRYKKSIILVSATADLATTWVSKIKTELECNETIITDFGNVQSSKWTESHIKLSIGTEIRARGAGAQIRGMRPDCVIVDDVEEDESVRSEEQRKKLEDWFWAALVNTLEPTSQLIVIGTLLHPLSFLTKLIDKPRIGWMTRKYKAIKDDGNALWPEKWSLKALAHRREEIGERRFRSEFMNDPLADGDMVFKSEWLDMNQVDCSPPRESLTVYTAVDPAISKTSLSDYTAIVTVGVHNIRLPEDKEEPNGEFYVLEAKRGRWSVYETVNEILTTRQRLKPKQIFCEEIQYQAALREVLIKESKDKGIPISVHAIHADKDKIRRAQAVSPLFEQGKVHLVYGGQDELRHELITFPSGEHDDLVDALVYALSVSSGGVSSITTHSRVGKQVPDIFKNSIFRKPKTKHWYNL